MTASDGKHGIQQQLFNSIGNETYTPYIGHQALEVRRHEPRESEMK